LAIKEKTMKNTILITAILLLGFITLSNAQESVSFRSNALGNIIDDDLDLVYDPIELRFVDGIRLYTNLSNLTSTHEQLFENVSDDEFLLGVSSQNPFMKFLWHSAMLRFQNSETSNSVEIDSDFDGWTDIYGNGTLIGEYTAYLDTDYDGLYDLKKMLSQEKSDFSTDDSYSFILNNTMNMWGLTLGGKLSVGDATYTGNSASNSLGSGYGVLNYVDLDDPTFQNSFTTHLIEDGYDNLVWSEDGDFTYENKTSFTNLDASVMLPDFIDFELRGDVRIYSNQNLSDINDFYTGEYEYFDPEVTSYTDTYSETDSYISETNEDGSGIMLGGSLRKTFNEQDQRKNDGFWKFGLSMNFSSYDYTNSSSSQFSSTEISYDGDLSSDDFEKTISEQTSISDIGDKKLNSFNFYGKFNIPLGEYVHFGIGGFLNQSKSNRETDYTETVNDVTDYNYTDSDYNDSDYVTTETSQLTADRNYDVSTTVFTCPVGLEYKIGKKRDWSLRFGSIFTSTNQTINDAKQITDSEPYVIETVYGDGDVTIDIDDNIYESTSEHARTTTSSTVFTYGLGYNPMDNLQIDLLGIGSADLEFDGVRLSFSLLF